MSIECNNTTPFSARFDSAALTPASAVFTEIEDFGSLIDQSNPLDFVNRDSVLAITNRMNDILPKADLSDFPTLQKKYQQFPITATEVADYVLTNSIDTDSIIAEFDNFSPDIGFTAPINAFLDGFDFHLDLNIGKSLSDGTCARFGNILLEIAGFLNMIDTAKKDLAEIIAFLQDLDPQKLLASLKSKLTLAALQEAIEKAIEKIIKKVRKEIDEALAKFKVLLFNLPCASKQLIQKLQRKYQKAKNFFTKENMIKFKDKVKEFITKQVAQFERVSLETLGLLMYKLCQFVELLHEFLHGPSKDLLRAAEVIAVETKALKNIGLTNTLSAVENGAVRKDADQCIAEREEVVQKINDSEDTDYHLDSKCPTKDEIQLLMSLSDDGIGEYIKFADRVVENREWQKIDMSVWLKLIRLQKLAEDSTTVITVNQGFRPLKGKKAKMGTRSKFAHKTAFAIDIDIPSSFRLKGKSKTSNAVAGTNVVIPTIDINIADVSSANLDGVGGVDPVSAPQTFTNKAISTFLDSRESLIVGASKVGFTGIGMYKTYLHLDLGARRAWIAGQPGIESKVPNAEKLTAEETSRLKKIETIHEADAWRKDTMLSLKNELKVYSENVQPNSILPVSLNQSEPDVEKDDLVTISEAGYLDTKGNVRKNRSGKFIDSAIEELALPQSSVPQEARTQIANDDPLFQTAAEKQVLADQAAIASGQPLDNSYEAELKRNNPRLSNAEIEKLIEERQEAAFGGTTVSEEVKTLTQEQLDAIEEERLLSQIGPLGGF